MIKNKNKTHASASGFVQLARVFQQERCSGTYVILITMIFFQLSLNTSSQNEQFAEKPDSALEIHRSFFSKDEAKCFFFKNEKVNRSRVFAERFGTVLPKLDIRYFDTTRGTFR